MQSVSFLSLFLCYASLICAHGGNSSSQATLPVVLDHAIAQARALEFCGMIELAANHYGQLIEEALAEKRDPELMVEIVVLKIRFLELYHLWIHQNMHQELRALLIATNELIQQRINPYYYSMLESEGVSLRNQAGKKLEHHECLTWKLRFNLLCSRYFKTVMLDTIDQEIKNKYLDFLFDTINLFREKRA